MTAAGAPPVDVILRDGSTLRLRPPVAADGEAVLEFFEGLSPSSRYARFHGLPALNRALVDPTLDPDWEERGALVGTLGQDDGERIVAVANYARLRDPALAEAAFAVADDLQGKGIGTRLLERLAARAAQVGIERFVAEVMADNRKMLGVFEAAGFELTRELEQGAVEVQFPIASTESYRRHVDERDHTAVVASLRPFFEPRTVAVIGASRRRRSIGGELFRNILGGDFRGAAYPVNRGAEPVAGVRAYTSVAEIPDTVDLAVIAVAAEAVVPAAEEALRAGVRALVVISAGFAEVGQAGLERQEQLLAAVRAHGARLIGPNCLGLASAAPSLNATFAARSAAPGSIGFSSQSGALGLALLEAAEPRGLGLSAFVSIGNKADVSSNDLLEWWEDDPATSLVLLYVESFGNPRRFGRLAQRVARRKPVLALKSGVTTTGQRAASSHTAALAGSDAAVDTLFRQAGVIRAGSLEELIDVAALLSSQPEPKGRRVAILTNAGGLGILCADACDAAGLELPELDDATRERIGAHLSPEASLTNPVDMLGGATAETYERVLPILLESAQVDAVIVLFVPTVTRPRTRWPTPSSAPPGPPPPASRRSRSPSRRTGSRSRSGARVDTSPASRTRSPPRARSAGRRSGRTGSAGRTASRRRSTASTARRRSRWWPTRWPRPTTPGWGRTRCARSSRRTGSRSSPSASPRRRTTRRPRLRSSASPSSSSPPSRAPTRRRPAGSRSASRTRTPRGPRRADRLPRRRAAVRRGRRRAARRCCAGRRLRAARRLRAGRSPCRADRGGVVPDVPADGRRRARARHRRQGGPARRRVPGRAARGHRRPRRSRAAARAPRR